MEKKYRIGDRVKIIDSIPDNHTIPSSARKWLGKTMTILGVTSFKGDCFYIMKEDFGEHTWGASSIASFAEDDRKIIASYDGKVIKVGEVINGKLIKSTEVACKTGEDANPEAELKAAIEEFFKRKVEMYSSKLVCVCARSASFTKGKIYEVINGVLIDDNGDKYENMRCFNDIISSLESKFIEIVEPENTNDVSEQA